MHPSGEMQDLLLSIYESSSGATLGYPKGPRYNSSASGHLIAEKCIEGLTCKSSVDIMLNVSHQQSIKLPKYTASLEKRCPKLQKEVHRRRPQVFFQA